MGTRVSCDHSEAARRSSRPAQIATEGLDDDGAGAGAHAGRGDSDGEAVREAVRRVVVGKDEVVDLALVALLAEGHLLVEDVPGVGKTLLAKALARTIDCSVRRIQFTPDLLPSDVTGVSIWNQERGDFEFRPGAVFANVVIGDEINRASPKTQSALLESMEEQQVTVDGSTYPLPPPFIVVATQNPVEMDGTYPLPEAQRDRFMVRVAMGYPRPEDELGLLDTHVGSDPLLAMTPVADAEGVRRAIVAVAGVHVSDALRRYVLALSTPPAAIPTCASGPRRAPGCSWSGPGGRWPRSRAATTCSPTTSRASRRPSWPTACCPAPGAAPPARTR